MLARGARQAAMRSAAGMTASARHQTSAAAVRARSYTTAATSARTLQRVSSVTASSRSPFTAAAAATPLSLHLPLSLRGGLAVRSFSSLEPRPPVKYVHVINVPAPVARNPSAPAAPWQPVPVLTPVETWKAKRTRLWASVKHEARHYWLGTKLLWKEVRLAWKLCRQIARGHEMTRRERRQLLRTCADLVFPNMLPSTYLDSTGREAKLQKQLLVKMEMARFLQETTHLLAQQLATTQRTPDGQPLSSAEVANNAAAFRDFMEKVRLGEKVRNEDILGFSKLFDSELTLDNLDQKQLEAMCRLLDIKVFGSLWVLRYKLEERLKKIQKDDVLIQKDGIAALNQAELEEACRARGIFTGKDETYLRRKLSDWLELSLVHKVPIALLLLSRAFSRQMTGAHDAGIAVPEGGAGESDLASDLATTLAHVPAVAVAEAEKEAVDRSDDRAARLQLLEEEAVEAAFEELKASKTGADSKSRSAKLASVKPAVGVTAEKIARLEKTNDDVEGLIDATIAAEALEAQRAAEAAAKLAAQEKAAAAAKEAAGTPLPAVAVAVPASPAAADGSATPAVAVAAVPAAPSTVAAADAAAVPAAVAAPVLPPEEKSSKKTKAKTVLAVDKLNDSIGAIIDDIKSQAQQLERESDGAEREERSRAAAAPAQAAHASAKQ